GGGGVARSFLRDAAPACAQPSVGAAQAGSDGSEDVVDLLSAVPGRLVLGCAAPVLLLLADQLTNGVTAADAALLDTQHFLAADEAQVAAGKPAQAPADGLVCSAVVQQVLLGFVRVVPDRLREA